MATETTNLEFKIQVNGVEQSVTSIDKLKEHATSLRKEFETTTDPKRFKQLQTELTKTNTILKTMDQTIEGADPQRLAQSFFKLAEGVNGAFQISKIAGFGDKTIEVEKSIMQILSLRALAEGVLEGVIATKNIQQAASNALVAIDSGLQSKNIVIKYAAAAAQRVLNAVINANPYVLAATAIIAMASALYAFTNNSDEAAEKQEALNLSVMRSVIASNMQAKNDKENIRLTAQANLIQAKRNLTYEDEIDLLAIKTLQQQNSLKLNEDLAAQELKNIDIDLRKAMMRDAEKADIDALQAKKVEALLKQKKASEDLNNFLLFKETNTGAEISKIQRKYDDINKTKKEKQIDLEFKYQARKISLMNDGVEKEKALAKLEYDQAVESARRTGESKIYLYKLYQKKLYDINQKENDRLIQIADDNVQKQIQKEKEQRDNKNKELQSETDNKLEHFDIVKTRTFQDLEDETKSYEFKKQSLKDLYASGLITTKEYNDKTQELLSEQMTLYGQLAGSVGNALSVIGANLDQSSDEYKAFALAQIIASQGMATANAAAAAFSPASPDNLLTGGIAGAVKMAVFIASLTALFGQIYSTVNKFEDGGMVNGASHKNGGVKYAVGGTVAELEGGEAILNKRAMAQPILRDIAGMINTVGGGVNFGNGNSNISNQPQKVYVTYKDIKDMDSKVKIVETNSKFKM